MKRSLFALILALVLLCSFACGTASNTTGQSTQTPPNIAESEQLVFNIKKEVRKDNYEWYYKTVTNEEDIAAIAEAVDKALENATVKPSLAEGELAKSRTQIFQIRILNGGGVTVYNDGITAGTAYLADTTELVATLTEIYDKIDCAEQPCIPDVS